jgi:hypothetical protein
MKAFIKQRISEYLLEYYTADFDYPEIEFNEPVMPKKPSMDSNFKNLVKQLGAKKVPNKQNTYAFLKDNTTIYFKPNGKNSVELDLIETPAQFRGEGNAKMAMSAFLNVIDKNKTQVQLSVMPRDKQTTTQGLEKFYSSFGFRKTNDFEMTRH